MGYLKKNGLTGIIPFTYFGGAGKAVGSTLLRVDALVAHSNEFEIWQHGKSYESLIFQKVYWPEMMRLFRGPKILDLCDPNWVTDNIDIMEIGSLVHAITCSSPGLTDLVKKYFPDKPILHIPDRLDFSSFIRMREPHKGRAKNLVWFGFIHNAYEVLPQLFPEILKYGLTLTVIADLPYERDDEIKSLNPIFISYSQHTIHDYIMEADIVLNPHSNRALFKYKSNNKSIISWKLGLPVAAKAGDIELLLDAPERNKQVYEQQIVVNNEYNILESIGQYTDLIMNIKNQDKSYGAELL